MNGEIGKFVHDLSQDQLDFLARDTTMMVVRARIAERYNHPMADQAIRLSLLGSNAICDEYVSRGQIDTARKMFAAINAIMLGSLGDFTDHYPDDSVEGEHDF